MEPSWGRGTAPELHMQFPATRAQVFDMVDCAWEPALHDGVETGEENPRFDNCILKPL